MRGAQPVQRGRRGWAVHRRPARPRVLGAPAAPCAACAEPGRCWGVRGTHFQGWWGLSRVGSFAGSPLPAAGRAGGLPLQRRAISHGPSRVCTHPAFTHTHDYAHMHSQLHTDLQTHSNTHTPGRTLLRTPDIHTLTLTVTPTLAGPQTAPYSYSYHTLKPHPSHTFTRALA